MGKARLNENLRYLARICHVENWNSLHNHLQRGEGLTDFSNDPNINIKTRMRIAGHTSVQSGNAYIKSDIDQNIALSECIHQNKKLRISYDDDKVEEKKGCYLCFGWLTYCPICYFKKA
mmetsp:Transcript_33979/g.49775  ORF Transcript_33979/g.49775 Transcript_33979/m.49775 type:complete len:119 (-) Transcript_33979:241-597(-)